MFKYVIVLFLIPSLCSAGDFVLGAGAGVGNGTGARAATLGLQHDLIGVTKTRITFGGWFDGRAGSALASGQIGYEVQNGGLVLSVFTGPALITSPSYLLGGVVQFMSDLHLGVQDNGYNYLGLFYRHVSSAGLYEPNLGMDIIGLEIRGPL